MDFAIGSRNAGHIIVFFVSQTFDLTFQFERNPPAPSEPVTLAKQRHEKPDHERFSENGDDGECNRHPHQLFSKTPGVKAETI